MKLLMPEISR